VTNILTWVTRLRRLAPVSAISQELVRFDPSTSHRSGVRFAELLKVQARLALREPSGLLGGIALPVVLLAVFGFIGRQGPGNVGDSGLTIMYYSPSGAAARALLDAVFTSGPSSTALLTMAIYTVIFGFVAIRYFHWE
jgi:hypothetical protein